MDFEENQKAIDPSPIESNLNIRKFQEENIEFFFKELAIIDWKEPEEAKKAISKLIRDIDKKYFTLFEIKLSSTLIPELKKKKDKLDLQEEPYFLKNGFVADASFLTNYQKINKFIRDHQENTNPDVSPNQKYKPNELSTVSQPKFTKPHPFETHLTNKNVCDVHANSKHFFPIYKDIQFTDFGELNKEKSNSNNFIIQKNWPNLQNKQYELQGFTGPEYTPEKNPYSEKNLYQAKSLYPSAIMKNETFTDFIKTEQKFKETQSTRLKQHIENLGGIEDTISIMNTNLKKNESLKLDLTNKLNLIDKKTNFSLQKFDKDLQYDNLLNKKNEIFTKEQFYPNDPFNQDPFFALNNMNLVNRSGFLSRDDLDDGFDNLVEEKLRRNKNKQNLEESFKVLKISKDLRKEKEGLFDRKKF